MLRGANVFFGVSVVLSACGGMATSSSTTTPAAPIQLGNFEAVLDASAPRDEAGRYHHDYSLHLVRGEGVRLHCPAGPLDPMIRVSGPNGFAAENDDAFPHTLDALVEFVAPEDGDYRVQVTTAPPGQEGRYQLHILQREMWGPTVVVAQNFESQLGASQMPQFPGRSFFSFHGDGGAIVRFRVTSAAFDTTVTVLGPSGAVWFNDDGNDVGANHNERPLDSTLVVPIPVSGEYQIVVSSFGENAGGPFRVTSSERSPVVIAAGQTVAATGFAGANGQGRVLSVFAGITAYPSGPLFGCADDARKLGDSMRRAHLQRVDEQVVLADAEATRAAFLGGVTQMAARAVPDDVLFVFWSGHGNVQPVPAAPVGVPEHDGLDETIQMIDGPVVDDELMSALANTRAGTVILALDSCHSGGFAPDFLTHPGRVGLFSSDEGVLSDTAEPRNAGGYLSYYLRRGVFGHADNKPRDGLLHVGELIDYLVDGYREDHRLMNPENTQSPAQRLDARRTVGWDRELWVYPRGADLVLAPLPSGEI